MTTEDRARGAAWVFAPLRWKARFPGTAAVFAGGGSVTIGAWGELEAVGIEGPSEPGRQPDTIAVRAAASNQGRARRDMDWVLGGKAGRGSPRRALNQ